MQAESTCEVRVGFFSGQHCQQPRQSACKACGRACCAAHLRSNDVCVLCAVGAQEEVSGDDWAFAARDRLAQNGLLTAFWMPGAGEYFAPADLGPLSAADVEEAGTDDVFFDS